MGTMSAAGAAPFPRLCEVFFDVRGDSRTMRLSWYAGTGVAVFSIWHGDTCTGTFRLPIPELSRMVEVLTQGPPEAGDGPRAADPGAPTVAAGPGGMPAAVAGVPAGDYGPSPHDHDVAPGRYQDALDGYGGYGDAPPAGYQDEPTRAGYHDEPTRAEFAADQTRGYQGWAPDGYQDAPGGYQDASAGHGEFPPGGYQDAPGGYQDAPAGYQDASGGGYRDAPGSGYDEFAPAGGYQDAPYRDAPYLDAPYRDAPGGGYEGLPPGGGYPDDRREGYRDFPPGDGYGPPDNGYRDSPAVAGYDAPGHFAGSQETSYSPPSGPLGVGRWRSRDPEADYVPGQPAGDFSPGQEEDAFPADPLDVDYGGEAEQGYLPGPPTDTLTFPAAAADRGPRGEGYSRGPVGGGFRDGPDSGGYRGEGSDEDDGYEPDPADLDHDAGPPESLGHRRGPRGSRAREYGHSRGRS